MSPDALQAAAQALANAARAALPLLPEHYPDERAVADQLRASLEYVDRFATPSETEPPRNLPDPAHRRRLNPIHHSWYNEVLQHV